MIIIPGQSDQASLEVPLTMRLPGLNSEDLVYVIGKVHSLSRGPLKKMYRTAQIPNISIHYISSPHSLPEVVIKPQPPEDAHRRRSYI